MSSRGTIFASGGEIIAQSRHAGDQYVLRVSAPEAAATAVPGSFAHIRCDQTIPLRRPLSIMSADADAGWLDFLYRPVGHGLRALAEKTAGDRIDLLAPIGNGFTFDPGKPRVMAIGGGVGIPPMIFVAETLGGDAAFLPLVLMGSEVPFPFDLTAPAENDAWREPATASLKRLEDIGIPSRLASNAGIGGAFAGHVTELARHELQRLGPTDRAATAIVACGPEPMLKAAAKLAREFELPCQLAVEEFMACGVGGCAGCTILIETPEGPAMKRVCVDGPVFDAREVYP